MPSLDLWNHVIYIKVAYNLIRLRNLLFLDWKYITLISLILTKRTRSFMKSVVLLICLAFTKVFLVFRDPFSKNFPISISFKKTKNVWSKSIFMKFYIAYWYKWSSTDKMMSNILSPLKFSTENAKKEIIVMFHFLLKSSET